MQRLTFLTEVSTTIGATVIRNGATRNTQMLQPPELEREFRGLWVASVANIDFPSKSGISRYGLQNELRKIVSRTREINCNALIFQVRPACDALYESKLEPWSEYLTGTQGKSPGFDPLHFLSIECRKAGIELHAWFNPFRARAADPKSDAHPLHVSRSKTEMVREYGKLRWLDPGDPRVRQHTLDVIADVVTRYDIDGVHLDDYFYPYPESDPKTKNDIPFPDNPTFSTYQRSGGMLRRDDWRRSNVDVFVEALYRRVHAIKPQCMVGISPFGIYRPGQPPQIKGLDAFAQIYADSQKWLREGWVDYLAPQLYWPIERRAQSFPVLLQWWLAQNSQGRHVWPGLYTGKYSPQEIEFQIKTTRGLQGATGHIHFSMQALLSGKATRGHNRAAHLLHQVYAQPAIIPETSWLAQTESPVINIEQWDISENYLKWKRLPEDARTIALQYLVNEKWNTITIGPSNARMKLPDGLTEVWLTLVCGLGRQSNTIHIPVVS